MVEISDLFDILEQKPIALLFLPAAIFGYLFHLLGNPVFLSLSIIWLVPISLLLGIERSIIYPISSYDLPMAEEDITKKYDIEENLKYIILLIYAVYTGPIVILAALNNILSERQEIHLSPEAENFFYISEIISGILATNDLILFLLLGAHIVSYVVLVGPTLFFVLFVSLWWIYLFFRLLIWLVKTTLQYMF